MTALRAHLVELLAKLGVEEHLLPGRNDDFASLSYRGLSYRGKVFAHFHNDNELDIRLTKQVIAREKLTHPLRFDRSPKSVKGIALDGDSVSCAVGSQTGSKPCENGDR